MIVKKILIFISLILLLTPLKIAFAQSEETTEPTQKVLPTPTGINLMEQLEKIKILKEKVATKVSELRQTERQAVFGTVIDIKDESIKIKDEKENEINISVNEDTLYFAFDKSGKRIDSSKNKITKDMLISAFGFQDDKNLEGKYIYIETEPPLHLMGKIMDIDRKNFTLTLKNQSQKEWLIDIETFSRTSNYSKIEKTTKIGFSKLQPADLVHIIANKNTKEKDRAAALRIIKFADFSPKETVSPTPAP